MKTFYILRIYDPNTGETIYKDWFKSKEDAISFLRCWEKDFFEADYFIKEVKYD